MGFLFAGYIEAGLIEESDEFLAAAWLLQLTNGFGLDLTNTFAGHFKNVTDFFQRVAVTVTQSVSEFNDFPFAIAQGFQDLVDSRSRTFPATRRLPGFPQYHREANRQSGCPRYSPPVDRD